MGNHKKWKNCVEFFYTKCTVNSGKLQQNCVLWQKLRRFTNLSKLHKNCCAALQFFGGTSKATTAQHHVSNNYAMIDNNTKSVSSHLDTMTANVLSMSIQQLLLHASKQLPQPLSWRLECAKVQLFCNNTWSLCQWVRIQSSTTAFNIHFCS